MLCQGVAIVTLSSELSQIAYIPLGKREGAIDAVGERRWLQEQVLSVGGGWDPCTSDRIRTGQEHTPPLCHSNGRGGCVTSRRHRNIKKYGVGRMKSFFLLSFHSVKEEARPLTVSGWMIWQKGRCASVFLEKQKDCSAQVKGGKVCCDELKQHPVSTSVYQYSTHEADGVCVTDLRFCHSSVRETKRSTGIRVWERSERYHGVWKPSPVIEDVRKRETLRNDWVGPYDIYSWKIILLSSPRSSRGEKTNVFKMQTSAPRMCRQSRVDNRKRRGNWERNG